MGGKGANQAVAAARLGAEVTFVACVGNDTFGGEAMKRFQAESIDTSFVRQDGSHPTGTAAIVVDDNAENCIVIVPGANAGLSAADVRRAASVVQQADAVLCQLRRRLRRHWRRSDWLARQASWRFSLRRRSSNCRRNFFASATCAFRTEPKWSVSQGYRFKPSSRHTSRQCHSEHAA
jgi:hypothetical protein